MKCIINILSLIILLLQVTRGIKNSSLTSTHRFLQISQKAIDQDVNPEPSQLVHIISEDNGKIQDQKLGSHLRMKLWNDSNKVLLSNASTFYRQLLNGQKSNYSKIHNAHTNESL